MKKDYLAELRACTKAYHEAEQQLISTNPQLYGIDEENHSDSYKWLILPTPGEYPEMVSNMIASGVEDFPTECLAGILLAGLKNGVPTGVLRGLSIDRNATTLCFCISGSVSAEDLQTLCERYQSGGGFQVEK